MKTFLRRLRCVLTGHRFQLQSMLPKSQSEIRGWVYADYDYYNVCSSCGHSKGVGERYD